jgi:hypothetical protein
MSRRTYHIHDNANEVTTARATKIIHSKNSIDYDRPWASLFGSKQGAVLSTDRGLWQ